MSSYSYEIIARPVELGGGRRLRLKEKGEEVGGGVFPVLVDSAAGITWWNGITNEERAQWLRGGALPTAADAYEAYLLDEAYADAEETANEWLRGRA